MIENKIEELEKLVNDNSINDPFTAEILSYAKKVFILNEIGTIDDYTKEAILERWIPTIEYKIEEIKNHKKVL